jgi:hypothetical protein
MLLLIKTVLENAKNPTLFTLPIIKEDKYEIILLID